MASVTLFPSIRPSSRTFTPGRYPQTEFVAQNGAKTVIRYGNKQVDAKLTLGFTNITDAEVNQILGKYEEVNSVYDFIHFPLNSGLAGINDPTLRKTVGARDQSDNTLLRYRFEGPPTVTSVRPNRSNVQCKFVACLDGD